MQRFTRILVSMATVAAILWTASPVTTGEPSPLEIHGAGMEQAEVLRSAKDRYDRAGMWLPPLRIFVHSTKDPCNARIALFNSDGRGDRIDLCNRGQSDFIIMHELAHAWIHHRVSEATRREFLDRTGLTWNDPTQEWSDRGTEVAANIVAWGLSDRFGNDRVERYELFELLTGMPSPRLDGLDANRGHADRAQRFERD